jgi:hypothetical protein
MNTQTDNRPLGYAIDLLQSRLRDELHCQQQAAEIIDGLQRVQIYPDDVAAFKESKRLADERVPQLRKAIQILLAS